MLIDDQLLHMAVDKERLGCLVVIEGRQLSWVQKVCDEGMGGSGFLDKQRFLE